MSVPELTPVETPIFDDMVIERLEERFDDVPVCESRSGCDMEAVARFTMFCECKQTRLLCAPHLARTSAWFDQEVITCRMCGTLANGYQVVTL